MGKRTVVPPEQARGNAVGSFNSEDKLADAKSQGQAQFDSILEMVEALKVARDAEQAGEGSDEKVEEAERTIHEDALSVEVRSGWYCPGDSQDGGHTPEEYCILLCTGGPAVRIVGELSEHCEPTTACLEVQDWFTPWTEFRPIADSERAAEEVAKQDGWGIKEKQGDRCFIFVRTERGAEVDDCAAVTWGELCEYAGLEFVSQAEPILLDYARCFWFGE